MNETQKFLQSYSLFEETLREKTGKSVLDYENSLNRSPVAEKLQVCRIVRNYASHHNDGLQFLSFPEMTKFLESENLNFRTIHVTVERAAVKQEPITEKTSLKQAISILSKAKEGYAPIVDKDGTITGILTPESLLKAIEKCGRMTEKVVPNLRASDLHVPRDTHLVRAGTRLDRYIPHTRLILVDDDEKYQKIISWAKVK